MTNDAIVDEVRAIREAIAEEFHYDLDAIFKMLQSREAATGTLHVTLPPRLVQPPEVAGPR